MAALVRATHSLQTLQLTLDRSQPKGFPSGRLQLTLLRGREEILPPLYQDAQTVLPQNMQTLRRQNSDIEGEIFPDLVDQLRSQINPQEPLWLEFKPPLATVPYAAWEKILASLDVSVLHLPHYLLPPITLKNISEGIDIALFGSMPRAKAAFSMLDVLQEAVSQFLTQFNEQSRLHLFVDQARSKSLVNWIEQEVPETLQRRLVVHDPAGAAEFEPPSRDSRVRTFEPSGPDSRERARVDQLVNPWLLWIEKVLRDQTIDVIHFFGHGYLGPENGAIALAESPNVNLDAFWSRFVGAAEIHRLMDTLGAWCFVVGAIVPNFSLPGLRVMVDQLSRRRSGLYFLDDLRDGWNETVYSYLAGNLALGERAAPDLSISVHPELLHSPYADPIDDVSEAVWEEVPEMYGTLREQVPQKDQGVILKSSRLLDNAYNVKFEQAGESDSDVESVKGGLDGFVEDSYAQQARAAQREGEQNALDFVAELLQKYGNQ